MFFLFLNRFPLHLSAWHVKWLAGFRFDWEQHWAQRKLKILVQVVGVWPFRIWCLIWWWLSLLSADDVFRFFRDRLKCSQSPISWYNFPLNCKKSCHVHFGKFVLFTTTTRLTLCEYKYSKATPTHTQTHGLRLVLHNGWALLSGQCQWKQRNVVFGLASMSDCDKAGWLSGSAGSLIGHRLKQHTIGLLALWCNFGPANAVSLNTSVCKIHMQPMFPLSHRQSCVVGDLAGFHSN